MSKINTIIFSKDNAAQLRILLKSLNKNSNNSLFLNVIYAYSSETFRDSYEKIISEFSEIKFMESLDFKNQVIDILSQNFEYSTFMLDDDILFMPIQYEEITTQIKSDEDVVCFSLRLGDNVKKCYTLGADNVLYDIQYDGDIMKWDWSLHYLDFGYPFSLNGHIFRTKDILKLSKKTKFSNVEELEIGLFDFADSFPRNMMVSYKHNVLINVPIARVQMSIDNEVEVATKDMQTRGIREKMNQMFLTNNFIDLESIEFNNIDSCHKEINLGI